MYFLWDSRFNVALPQLKASETNVESLATQLHASQVEEQRQKNEISKLQVQLHKLKDADAHLKESREEIITVNMAKQAIEDEKAILQGACDRYADCFKRGVRALIRRLQIHKVAGCMSG